MDIEEQIRHRFDAVADKLRDEFARQLKSVTDELAGILEAERAAYHTEREGLQRDAEERLAASRAEADARAAEAESRGRKAGLLDGKQQGMLEGLAQGRHEGSEATRAEIETAALAASERLTHAIQAIDRATSLSEILDVLASAAGREVSRIALLLVAGDRLRGWRLIGFENDDGSSSQLELSLNDSGIVAEAVRSGAATSADSAGSQPPSFASLPPGRELLALPLSMNGQVVAVLYGDEGGVSETGHKARLSWPATLEVMARHAARSLQAVTAFRAAQALTERPRPGAGSRPGQDSESLPRTGGDESEEESARRYARLLISEIRFSHEAEVVAGRRERDLVSRLGPQIAKARTLYSRRVTADLGNADEIFDSELIRSLADGDRALLGA